jgi:hypothetical protein
MTENEIVPTLFEYKLSDAVDTNSNVLMSTAEELIAFFAAHPLFKWGYSHNGCEARADAVCVLLDEWGIPNYKAWVFSGRFLKSHVGELKQNWKYHVAALLPVLDNGEIIHYVIDPATSAGLQTMYGWAANVTDYAHSYHFVKEPHFYIFHDRKITQANWHERNRRNRKWMIQGLANVNGLTAKGKAALIFNKGRIKNTAAAFERLKKHRPSFL